MITRRASIWFSTFKTEFVNVNVADGGHVAEHGENDESGQQTGAQIDGTCQQGVAVIRNPIVKMRIFIKYAITLTRGNCCETCCNSKGPAECRIRDRAKRKLAMPHPSKPIAKPISIQIPSSVFYWHSDNFDGLSPQRGVMKSNLGLEESAPLRCEKVEDPVGSAR